MSHEMPKPKTGDVVLYSNDVHNFSNPTLAWVISDRGEGTTNLLVFANGAFLQKSSVHHRSDPGLQTEPGWFELGAWDYAPITQAIYKAASKNGEKQQQQAQPQPAGK